MIVLKLQSNLYKTINKKDKQMNIFRIYIYISQKKRPYFELVKFIANILVFISNALYGY